MQTPFLRDLFVCMVMAPLFVRLRNGWLIALTVGIAVWAIGGWWFPLILRPQIPLFFLLGIAARRWDVADRVAAMPFPYALLPFALLAPVKLVVSIWGFQFGLRYPEMVAAIDLLMRLAAAMLMWRIATGLVDRPVAAMIKRIEPYAFLLFCSHLIMVWLFGQRLGRISGPLDAPGYPIFLLLHPVLILGATIVLGRLLIEISPGAANWLSGGRLRAEPMRGRARPALDSLAQAS